MKRIMYVDCTRGIASDMFLAALLGCFESKDEILQELQVNINNNMVLTVDYANSYDRTGLLFAAKDREYSQHMHENCTHHSHSDLKDVHSFIDATGFSASIKGAARGVYDIIAAAEAQAHGVTVDTVHFHEVGQKRAIACIVCACALLDRLKPDGIIFSGINAGYGKVICAHGEMDVPTPATKAILSDIPHFYIDRLKGELCTPTGAALAKYFAKSFIPQSDINSFQVHLPERVIASGIGLGRRDIGIANGIVITIVGE